ncbi:MAG: ABC transporter permease [Anaerolineae bacterium]|nr:ABC transporter permease [Anaerolineae bacterium]
MGVIRYKIWSDLWNNKGRTLQVVLIIAMGAFAIGMIIGGSSAVGIRMGQIWQASAPSMINLWVDPRIDDNELTALKSVKGIEDIEGYLSTTIEWRLSPDQPWQPGGLIARDDYKDQTFNKLELLSGRWPTRKGLAVEKSADTYFKIYQGQQLYIRINDHEYTRRIEGTVYNPMVNPPGFGGKAQFYASRDEYTNLTGEEDFNQILASAPVYEPATVTDVVERLQRQLEKQDIDSGGAAPVDGDRRMIDPEKHFLQNTLDAIFLILGVMSGLALILGLLLVYNTITAIVSQQVSQIGVMKAIGASTGQILLVYFSSIFIYGFLALLVAVPLGAIGAQQLTNFLLYFFNIEPGPFTVSPAAVVAQVVIALLAPLLASLGPIFGGARITVREAISTYGLGGGGEGRLERLLARVQRLSRLVLLTLSNTFRNKGRVILTQLTLVGSGLIFMMIMSVQDSVAYTFGDVLFSILRFNVSLQFEHPERIKEVESLTRTYPGVKNIEIWGLTTIKIRPAGQPESNADKTADTFGVPLPTILYGPQLRAGRWLQPGDRHAVVLNQKLAEEIGVKVGDWVTLDSGSHGESRWLVVGLLFDPIITASVHAPRETLLRELDSVNKAGTVWIQTHQTDAASEANVALGLRTYYDAHELKLNPEGPFAGKDTASQITAQILNNFGIIVKMLAAMAIIIALVGSIALSGVLSLNVRERTREIGVMRAIGASSWSVAGLFIGEGLVLGLLSWLIALPLSLPAGYLMTQAIGAAVNSEIVFHYTPAGALYWLGIITLLALVASWLPAQGATRVSVRESLAYQ